MKTIAKKDYVHKILIINPFGIGDVLFTTPLVSCLRRLYPDAFIGYVTNRRALPVVQSNPKINQVYVYDRDEFTENLIPRWVSFFKEIRQAQFEVVFDLSLNATFGFFCMACGIPKRIGYDYRQRGRFLTDKILLKGYETKHVAEYYLDLLGQLDPSARDVRDDFPTEFFIDHQHQQWAKDWMKAQGIDLKGKVIAVIPGGGASWGKDAQQKRWPLEQYVKLLDKIIAKSKAVVILLGDQKEQRLSQEITRQCSYPVYDAVGTTSLFQMAALLQLCHLAIVNDGGPLHVAVAVGTKTVSIFGPVDPMVYGPYVGAGIGAEDKHLAIVKGLACQPCYRQFRKAFCEHLGCLNHLTVDEVFNQIERLL